MKHCRFRSRKAVALSVALSGCAIAGLAAIAASDSRVNARQVDIAARSAQTPSGGHPGKSVYEKHCATCHGTSGQGDGPAAPFLRPRPRDFTAGKYKVRSTETGSPPTDDDLIRTVRRGLQGTSMPGWERLLPDSEIQSVVTYLKGFSQRFGKEVPQPALVPPKLTETPGNTARGAAAYEKLQCGKCHGSDGRGAGAVATALEDDWRQPLAATDLSAPWAFRGGSGPLDLYLRFTTGMAGSPMPSFKDAASDAELWDLAHYVLSLRRKPVWEMDAAEVARFYAQQDEQARANPVGRGEYLVETLGCALCHTPVDEEGRQLPGLYLAGGLRIRVEPFGEYPTGNLTSDKETGLGAWTDDEIKRVITRGTLRDGTRLLPFPMDWPSLSTMKSDDLSAVVAYLRTVPAVRNQVPPPTRTFLPFYLWGKFKMLVLNDDPPIHFYAGNAGRTGGRP